MVIWTEYYQFIAGQLYKLGCDQVLCRCALNHETQDVLWECHSGVVGFHVGRKATSRKVLQAGLWWPMVLKDVKEYASSYEVYQRVGRPSHQDEIPLQPICTLHIFEKWAVKFLGPTNPSARHSRTRYIITNRGYLTRWVEATLVKECTKNTISRFIFENIISRFGCP